MEALLGMLWEEEKDLAVKVGMADLMFMLTSITLYAILQASQTQCLMTGFGTNLLRHGSVTFAGNSVFVYMDTGNVCDIKWCD